MDADNSFDLEKVFSMQENLGKFDFVMATKYRKGQAKIQDSFLRRLLSLGGGIFSKFFFGLKFRDTQAGAKFFKRDVWKGIDRNFTCLGFDFDIEFLYKIHKAKFKIYWSYYL